MLQKLFQTVINNVRQMKGVIPLQIELNSIPVVLLRCTRATMIVPMQLFKTTLIVLSTDPLRRRRAMQEGHQTMVTPTWRAVIVILQPPR